MRLSNGWTGILLIPGFVGCGLGIYNLVITTKGYAAHLQGLSVQIAALSVIVVAGVFLLTALVLTRMDSIRHETLQAVGGDQDYERDENLQNLAREMLHEAARKPKPHTRRRRRS